MQKGQLFKDKYFTTPRVASLTPLKPRETSKWYGGKAYTAEKAAALGWAEDR